jgi:hypothetical protein
LRNNWRGGGNSFRERSDQMANKSKTGAAIVVMIGIIGTLATLLSMPDAYHDLRSALLIICALLILVGFAVALNDMIHLASAWSLLRNCRQLGIIQIHLDGKSGDELPDRLRHARTIKIMVLSGNVLIRQFKDEVVAALKNRAYVKVLLGTSGSDFVKDVEEAEAATRAGQINHELEQVEKLLIEYLTDATTGDPGGFHGKIEIGHFQTQFRSSLIICDDNWCKLTFSLAPKRAVQTPAMELKHCSGGLLVDCVQHFDRIWQLSQESGLVRAIQPMSSAPTVDQIFARLERRGAIQRTAASEQLHSPLGQDDAVGGAVSKATAFLAEKENRWYLDFAKHFYPEASQTVTALLKANSFKEFAKAAGAKVEVESSMDVVKNRLEQEGFTLRNETFSGVSFTGQEMVSKPKSIYGVHPSGAVLMCPTARRTFDEVHQEMLRRSKA